MGAKSHSPEQVTARGSGIAPLILGTSVTALLALAACGSSYSARVGSGPDDAGTTERAGQSDAMSQTATYGMPDSSKSLAMDAYVPIVDAAVPSTDAAAGGSENVANLCIYQGSVLPPQCNCKEIDASTGVQCGPNGVECLSCFLQPWCFCIDAQWSCGDPSLNDCIR
jgi:hypothetical protein